MGGFDSLSDGFGDVSVIVPDPARPTAHGEHLDREPGEGIPPEKDYDRGPPGIGPLIRKVEGSEEPSDGNKDGCGCEGQLPPNFA